MNASNPLLLDRDIRQRQIIPPARLSRCHAAVIGVGAIGRQVALQLAAIGIARLDLVDPDMVGTENLACQAYWEADVGQTKVEATAAACRLINPAVRLELYAERFCRWSTKSLAAFADAAIHPVVFCCVDSIATRQLIWDSVRSAASFFVDGRMSAEVIRVLAAIEPSLDGYYATTLFAPEQAQAGSCTAKSTIYTASIAAGLMLSGFTRWLRQLPVDRDLCLNLLSSELSVA